jgi:flagellin-like protein
MGYLFKGISPVVATVLLIAFSIAIATIVGTWAMNYTQKELKSLESDEYCRKVSIEKLDFNYNPISREGMVRLQNTGEKIGGYRIYAFNDETQELLNEYAIQATTGDIRALAFQVEISGVNEIMVEVLNCPTVKIRVSV